MSTSRTSTARQTWFTGLDDRPDARLRPLREPAPTTGPLLLSRRAVGSSDLKVFPLAVGSEAFGWRAGPEAAHAILDRYFEVGGNFVDTADSYAGGRSELMIGAWMRDRRNRSEIVLSTRVGRGADHPGVTPRALTRAVESSLQRLGTDVLDLLYLDVDDAEVPFEETLLTLGELVAAGKVRYIGASDHSGNRLIEARVIAAQFGAVPITAVQVPYSLADRNRFEGVLATIVAQQGLGVVPRRALAAGFLAGQVRSREGDAGFRFLWSAAHRGVRGYRLLATLDRVARDHHVAPATIALAWLLTKPNVVAPVAEVSRADHMLDLLAASAVQLTRHQVAELDRVSVLSRPSSQARRLTVSPPRAPGPSPAQAR